MNEFASTFKSPWVIGGGLALGAVLLLAGAKSSAQANGQSVATTSGGFPPSAVLAFNTQAMQEQTKQASIAADVGKVAINADVSKTVSLQNTIATMAAVQGKVQEAAIASGAGVIQSQIQTAGAIIVDQMNNTGRLLLGQQQTDQVAIASNAQVEIAKAQAKAVQSASTTSLISHLVGAAASIAAAPFTGGASLMSLPGMLSGPSDASLIASGFTQQAYNPANNGPIY